MNYNMKSILANSDPIVTFIHQMIPHHQNAVNMAKALLKTNTLDASDEDDREMENMMWAIIVACCVQINFNALHAIDAILAPCDSLVDFRTERPELPDPPDAGLSFRKKLRGVGHLRADWSR